jgi:hypothetical protein
VESGRRHIRHQAGFSSQHLARTARQAGAAAARPAPVLVTAVTTRRSGLLGWGRGRRRHLRPGRLVGRTLGLQAVKQSSGRHDRFGPGGHAAPREIGGDLLGQRARAGPAAASDSRPGRSRPAGEDAACSGSRRARAFEVQGSRSPPFPKCGASETSEIWYTK